MRSRLLIRLAAGLLGAVLAFPILLHPGMSAGGEQETPRLNFQNEKYEGLRVFKNIYSNEEYYRTNRQPIRLTNPEPEDIYDLNDLAFDEFRLVLYGSDDKNDLYRADSRPPMKGIPFQRMKGTMPYYVLLLHQNNRDLIVAPLNLSDYFLYYSNEDGTIDMVYNSTWADTAYHSLQAAMEPTADQTQTLTDYFTGYAEKNYYEKYLMDGAYYTEKGSPDEQMLFRSYQQAGTAFYTDSIDGSFYIFDGDAACFAHEDLDEYYVRVRETWQSVRDLNAERAQSDGAESYTGEYLYTIDDDYVTDVVSSARSVQLEIANRFDEAENELTVHKTVPFFGVAPGDVNPFRKTDLFEYKLLINGKVPASIQYTVTDSKTNEKAPAAAQAQQSDVVQVGDTYRYVTQDGIFHLYAEESATFYGVRNGSRVEIREFTNPDRYSVLRAVEAGAVFRYVAADDPENEEGRAYASITVQYGSTGSQRRDPTFTNVPNVLQVRKRIQSTSIDEEIAFDFTIQKLVRDPEDPSLPLMEDGEYVTDPSAVNFTYYVRDDDHNYDQMPRSAPEGRFSLRHEQTAMFVGLEADALYLVTELSDPAYNLLGENQRVLHTRAETVEDALIRSKSDACYELYINERDEMKGIVLTKKVADSDKRLNQNAAYTFRIEKLQSGRYVPQANMPYQYKNGVRNYQEAVTDENGYFRVKCNLQNFIVKFQTANGTYRITEVDPNDSADQNNATGMNQPNPAHEPHFYITDVNYDTYDVRDPVNPVLTNDRDTVTWNEDTTVHTDDIVLAGVTCSQTQSASIDFTNRVREKTYFLDLEKLAYLDDNIHDGRADETQRFVYRIERFESMEKALKEQNPLETFFTDLCCTDKFQVIRNGADTVCRAGSENYDYPFYPIDYTYTGRSGVINGDSVTYADEIVTRRYIKADTIDGFNNGQTETYQFFSTIYRGEKTLALARQGYYRITEISNWSGTDYDYCLKSNRYKGYLDASEPDGYALAKNRLFADYETTHAPDYDPQKGVLERAVVVYVGTLEDQTYPYTLGCEFFENSHGTVQYVMAEQTPILVQKRDADGNLIYLDENHQETTAKYDEDGSRNAPAPADLVDFRIQDSVNGQPLYFDENQREPVWQYTADAQERLEMELVPNPESEDPENPEMIEQLKAYPVYNAQGELVRDVTGYKLADAFAGDEQYYVHRSNIWSETAYVTGTEKNALRPMVSFSNVESEYALLSSQAWAENHIRHRADKSQRGGSDE